MKGSEVMWDRRAADWRAVSPLRLFSHWMRQGGVIAPASTEVGVVCMKLSHNGGSVTTIKSQRRTEPSK